MKYRLTFSSSSLSSSSPSAATAASSSSSSSSSSLARTTPIILIGLVMLTAVYTTLVLWFRNSTSIMGILPPPGKEYCPAASGGEGEGDEICSRSDLFAFQMSSFVAILFCGCLGFYSWHIERSPHTDVPQTSQGRLFMYLPLGEQLVAMNFTFQVFDFFVSLLIPEHCTAEMLTHHVLAATVSFMSLTTESMHYYSVYFLGIIEFSSIPLVFLDLNKFFPTPQDEEGSGDYAAYQFITKDICGPFFVITFVLYRVLLWWPVSYRFWTDVYNVVASGTVHRIKETASQARYTVVALWTVVVINLPLGLLQLYWLSIIAEEVRKLFLPPDEDTEAGAPHHSITEIAA